MQLTNSTVYQTNIVMHKHVINSMMPSVSYSQNITSWVVALFADWIY